MAFATCGLFGRERFAAGRQQFARIDQLPVTACAQVIGPQIQTVLVILCAAQIGDQLPIGRDARRTQALACQIGTVEQTVQGELFALSHRGDQYRNQQ